MTGDVRDVKPSASTSVVRPTTHEQRYDRQLRLWASTGQASLESARIAVLGASYLSACVLKNLVLPGVGSFCVVDARRVDEADVGGNFFVQSDAKGKSRAKEVALNLCELNPDVDGVGLTQEPLRWVTENDVDTFTLIIAVNQSNEVLVPLAEKAWNAKAGVGVPLMVVRGAGLIGEVLMQIKELGIVETHPESTVDLRLTRPWPELQTYAQSYDIQADDSLAYSHIPFIVILLRRLEEWKEAHQQRLPQPSGDDRKEFIASVHAFRLGNHTDEENVDEAVDALGQHVWRPIRASSNGGGQVSVPDEIEALFNAEQCANVTKQSTNFWLLVRALREFVRQGDGTLPVAGSLPDLKAQSATYIELQRLYRGKALKDIDALRRHLDRLLYSLDLPIEAISQNEVESFAKHAAYLRLIRGKRLFDVIERPSSDAILAAFADPVNPVTIPWHVALSSSQEFYARHAKRFPGSTVALSASVTGNEMMDVQPEQEKDASIEEDEAGLSASALQLLKAWNVYDSLDEDQLALIDDACAEIVRSGHCDVPSTSALLGGVVAQEAIKLVTRQYVPLDNVAVYDGIKQAIGVFQL